MAALHDLYTENPALPQTTWMLCGYHTAVHCIALWLIRCTEYQNLLKQSNKCTQPSHISRVE